VIAERKGLERISCVVRVFAVRSCYVFALSLSCATPKEQPATPASEADRAAPAVNPGSDAAPVAAPIAPASASAAPSSTAGAKPADTPDKTCSGSASAFGFTRVSADVVTSLSTGKAGHVALLSNLRAKVYDGKTFRTIEPDLTATPGLNVSIFFGRDNRPRLMGYADDGQGGLEQRYLRERGGDAIVVAEARHLRVGLLDGTVDRFLQLVVLDHHGFDAEAGRELDFIDGVEVRRIRHGQEQALATAEDRQHAVLGQQLVRDELDDVGVGVRRVEVEKGHAELVGGGDGDVARIGGTARDELRDDARLFLARGVERLEHGGLFDDAVMHEPLRQTA
jgi:hypothetical protein